MQHPDLQTRAPRRRALAWAAPVLCLGFGLSPTACAPDLSGDDAGDDGPPVVVEDNGDGSSTIIVDGRDDQDWVYFDLESSMEVSPTDPGDSPAWDLGVLRFNVKTNGGTSGTGMVGVAVLEGVTFDSVEQAPADGYISDEVNAGPADMEPEPGYAFDLWYDYDMDSHTLAPRAAIYVVRTVEENYFKIEFLDYYNDAGTAGYVKFRTAPIAAPG